MDAIGVGAGDEVITTAFTFVASTETIVQTGAKPVFVDIDPITYCIDPALIEKAITPQTKAIMPIHLFGQLADVERITEISKKHNLPVIEDAAQAFDCTFNGKPAGNFGVAAGFSFYVTKNLGACGDGGMIITNSDEIAVLRVSDADRNGTLRRLHNAVALGLIDMDEFSERSALVALARQQAELAVLVGDLPAPNAIVTGSTDRVELRGVMGSLKRQGEWVVPTRLSLVRRVGSIDLDLTRARFGGPIVVIELDLKFSSLDLRLPDGASASIDDVEVAVGSATDHRKDAPSDGTPHVILTGRVVFGSVDIRGPRRTWFGRGDRT